MKNIISIAVLSIFVLVLSYFANNSYIASVEYEKEYQKYANTKTIEKNLQKNTQNLINNLFSVFLGKKEIKQDIKSNNDDMSQIKKYEKIIDINLQYFIITLLLSLFTYFIFSKTIVLAYIHIIALGTLTLGLISPIFLMYIVKNIAGSEIILQFESSTIISSIEKLFLQDNYFVGGIILLFSIIFPIFKTIISFLALAINNSKTLNIISYFSSKITKFSMTDVFVLSIFLVYLSPKADGIIKTQLELGFYFFFIYVILSMITSLNSLKNIKN